MFNKIKRFLSRNDYELSLPELYLEAQSLMQKNNRLNAENEYLKRELGNAKHFANIKSNECKVLQSRLNELLEAFSENAKLTAETATRAQLEAENYRLLDQYKKMMEELQRKDSHITKLKKNLSSLENNNHNLVKHNANLKESLNDCREARQKELGKNAGAICQECKEGAAYFTNGVCNTCWGKQPTEIKQDTQSAYDFYKNCESCGRLLHDENQQFICPGCGRNKKQQSKINSVDITTGDSVRGANPMKEVKTPREYTIQIKSNDDSESWLYYLNGNIERANGKLNFNGHLRLNSYCYTRSDFP